MSTDQHMELTRYENHGIAFEYPAAWEVDEDMAADTMTITLQTGQTGFWSISIMPDRPRPEDVLHATLAAFEESYPELEHTRGHLACQGHQAITEEINFVCHDLTNTALLLAVRTGRITAFVLAQYYDQEEEELKPLFQAITRSLTFDPGDDIILS